jgi:hypothetical protein
MMLLHKQLRTQALADAAVKAEFDKLRNEFSLFDEFLKARTLQDHPHTRRISSTQPGPNLHEKSARRRFERKHHDSDAVAPTGRCGKAKRL